LKPDPETDAGSVGVSVQRGTEFNGLRESKKRELERRNSDRTYADKRIKAVQIRGESSSSERERKTTDQIKDGVRLRQQWASRQASKQASQHAS
jgi:hypothetical protein